MIEAMTKKQLAELAGYTYRRIYDIDKNLPKEKKLFVETEGGKYDPCMFVQRWVDYNMEQGLPDVEDLEVVKARHEVIKTQKTELEVARMRGQLVDVQDVKRIWGDVLNALQQNLLHLPSKVGPMVQGLDSLEIIEGLIDAEIRNCLNGASEAPLPDYADETVEEADEEEAES